MAFENVVLEFLLIIISFRIHFYDNGRLKSINSDFKNHR